MTKVHCLKRLLNCLSGVNIDDIEGDSVCDLLDEICHHFDKSNLYKDNEEIITGKTWIDDKPIYKIIVKTTLGSLAAKINEHNIDTIVSFYGQAVSMWGNQAPIPSCIGKDARYTLDLLQNNTTHEIAFQYGEYYKDDYSAYAVVEFTKKEEVKK